MACFFATTAVLFLWLLVTVSAGTTPEGVAWLAEKAKEPGVITLPSGLQYKVLRSGAGGFHPGIDASCSCHYHGTTIDGETFDSSYDRGSPTSFAPNQVIKGWTEAMQLMVEGDKWEMYIPSELGYGDSGSGAKIPPGAVLIFQMEILKIEGANKVAAVKCHIGTKTNCNEREEKYMEKVASSWDEEKQKSELARLIKIVAESSQMKPELAEWAQRRLNIVRQTVEGPPDVVAAAEGEDDASTEPDL